MPSCKYCNEPMKRVMDVHTGFAYYRCVHCGSCGPHVKCADKIGWEEELDLKTLGQSIDVKTTSAENDLRNRNDVLSGRYSKLKACDLPSVNRILRETQQEMMSLQDGREDYDKPYYLEKMAAIYKKKATYLKYKFKYEEELRSIKEQIRDNKKKLKELKSGREEAKKPKGPKNGKGKSKVRAKKANRS